MAGKYTPLEYVVCSKSTSICISERAKQKLETLKRDDETFDELLDRLARTEKDVEALAGFADENVGEGMEDARERLDDSLEERVDRME